MSTTILFRQVTDAFQTLAHGRTHFDEEWDRFKTRAAADLQGCWAGQWESARNGKRGPIRCVFTKIAPATYVASFCVKWFSRFPFTYDVQLRVLDHGGRFDIEGAADLGLVGGGVHHLQGRGTTAEMWCRYSSGRDEGKLELKRAG